MASCVVCRKISSLEQQLRVLPISPQGESDFALITSIPNYTLFISSHHSDFCMVAMGKSFHQFE